MGTTIKGSVWTNSSRRPDEGPSFHVRGASNRGNKKGRSDLNRNGLVLLATCFGPALAMFSRLFCGGSSRLCRYCAR